MKASEGALHLILFDTSPLKGFVQMCNKLPYRLRVNRRNRAFRRRRLINDAVALERITEVQRD